MTQDALAKVLKRIEDARLDSTPVALLAVSKQQSVANILALYQQGQRAFGENYCQEALSKMDALKTYPLEWHFIGHCQRNKTKKIAENFDWVQSVDSPLIAKRLNEARPAHLPPLNICIELNMDDETSKAGIPLSALHSLADICLRLPRLRLRGLMCIPKKTQAIQAFKACKAAFDALHRQGIPVDTLSMGMSADFETAIQAGSTMVRIGTALFPPRSTQPTR